MFAELTARYHLHPIVDHFTIALLVFGVAAEFLAAAAARLARGAADRRYAWSQQLRSVSLILMAAGAGAAVFSYLTGDSEAERLWDTMSPAAQQLLAASDGAAQYLSHAMLGRYLMYAFLMLASWRVLMEFSARVARWRIAFLAAAALALCALLYQGKTGGELVYDYGVGITRTGHSQSETALHR